MLTVADMLETALTWHSAGYSVIPIKPDGSKQPAVPWQEYQQRQPDAGAVVAWGRDYAGMGVACGGLMNLEMLEVEGYAIDTIPVAKQLLADHDLGDVWDALNGGYLERSPRGGVHWYFRTEGPARGNTKLARRPGAKPGTVDVLWETRGQGGQSIIAPSGGPTSRDGAWTVLRGTVHDIPVITTGQRDALYAVLAMLDELPTAAPEPARPTGMLSTVEPTAGDLRPGDDYNARATWDDLLLPRGWRKVARMGSGWTWQRPDKDGPGISATTGQARDGVDRLYVFSTSTEFEDQRPYTKFAAYALLEHGGDYSAAGRALRAAGYGSQTVRPAPASGATGPAGAPVAPEVDLEDAVFGASAQLGHIRTAARARLVSPWALLGAVLARAVAEVLPNVALPAIIGTRASLNLYVALVGPSGAAKTTAAGVSDDLLDLGTFGGVARVQGTGSGEGLVASFLAPDPENKGHYILKDRPHVCIVIDEIGQIAAIQNRQGSSLAPILRSGWSGSALDNINADPARRRIVPKMAYRLTAIAGVQPLAADVLFADADTGTPQRWVWLPALDPRMPDTEPEWPGRLAWTPPDQRGQRDHHGQVTVTVPDHVRDALREAHRARNRGQVHDMLDGHLALTRLKVAAALGILHGAYAVEDWAWDVAGHIIDVSTGVRGDCQRALAEQAQRAQVARGRGDHARESGRREAVAEAVTRDAARVHRAVTAGHGAAHGHPEDAGCTRKCITVNLPRRTLEQRDAAIAQAIDMGWIDAFEVTPTSTSGRHSDVRYRPGASRPAEAS